MADIKFPRMYKKSSTIHYLQNEVIFTPLKIAVFYSQQWPIFSQVVKINSR